jgi:hypothetical protein
VPEALSVVAAPRPTLSPTTLPFTGDGTGLVALLALTSLTVGGGLVVAGRRQTV